MSREFCCRTAFGTGKLSFPTRSAAKRAAKRDSRRYGVRLEPYECRLVPGQWHLRNATRRARIQEDRVEWARVHGFGGAS